MKELEDYLKKATKPRKIRFWGENYKVAPALVTARFGDGLQIVWVTPIDARPFYYLICIDSKTDIESDDFEWDKQLLQPIEEEYDNIDNYEEREDGKYYNPYDEDAEPFDYKFPMLSWGGGSWGVEKNFGEMLTAKSL